MKKTILFIAYAITAGSLAQAQLNISENAIGLRTGGGDGFGTEVSYQRALGNNNRLEVDLGIRSGDNFDGFQLAGIYHWMWNLDGGFNWYAGPGAGVATIDFDRPFNESGDDSETALFLAGQIGIEYNFDFPLQLSIDTRPALYFGDNRDDFELLDLALGIRYQF